MKKNYFLTLMIVLSGFGAFSQLTAPFTESFTGGSTSVPPTGWSESWTSGDGWSFDNGAGYGINNLPDHTGTGSETHFAHIDFSSPADFGAILQSDTINVSALTTPELKFYFLSNYLTYILNPENGIYVEAYNGTSWITIDSIRQNNFGTWSEHFYNVGAYVFGGNKLMVRLRGEEGGSSAGGTGSGFYHDLAIDDISVVEFTPCRPVTNINSRNITASGATVGWTTATGADTAWIVEYGPIGFTPGTGITMQVSVDSADITGLSSATLYDFYITGLCNTGDTSGVVGPNSFITACTGGLAGNYTIDAGSPTAGTNFNSFGDFFSTALNCGLSAATFVDVVAGSGPYIVSSDLPNIPGSSAANTLTMNGNGNTINHGGGAYFLALNGVKHLTITNFNFINETASSNVFGIMLRGGCDSVTIKNNTINVGLNITSSLAVCITATNSLTSTFSYGDNANNCRITGNTLIGGYAGIIMNGQGSFGPFTSGHIIDSNDIQDFQNYGIRLYYAANNELVANEIHRPNKSSGSTFYGIYGYYSSTMKVIGNKIHDGGAGAWTAYGIYARYGNSNSATDGTEIANNAVYDLNAQFTFYGAYVGNSAYTNVHHNTFETTTDGSASTKYGIYHSGAPNNVDYKNNLISIKGTGTSTAYGIYNSSTSTSFTSNYNLVYVNSGGTNYYGRNGSNYATQAAWNTGTTFGTNSLDINPSIVATLYTPLSATADNGGTPIATITSDIDGMSRSATTPDFGAVEFIGLLGDISINDAWLEQVDACYGTSDTAWATITNDFGSTVDFSINALTVNWTTTGPVADAGTLTINTGTLAVGASMDVNIASIDMSLPGVYTLSANIGANTVNASTLNDTLMNHSTFDKKAMIAVNPKSDTIVLTLGDSTKISTQSPFFPGGSFLITEVSHYASAFTGRPLTGKPSWLIADDYIEVTGVPGSDLAGYTYERWSSSSMSLSYTFPAGTILNSNGTAIIGGGIANDVTNAYYGAGGSTNTLGSSSTQGHVIKDGSGNVVDAVGYYNYNTFPTASGVTTSDWSSGFSHSSGTWGIRLTGADVNSATNWILSSNTIRQDPNVLNAGVTLPTSSSVAGLQWSDVTGIPILLDTTSEIYAKGWTTNGLYQYEATFVTPCGTYSDTADILVLLQTLDTVASTVCDTFTTPLGGIAHTSSGIYSDTIMGTVIAYDSVIHFYNVTVNYKTTGTIAVSICDSLQAPSGVWFNATGTYTDIIPNSIGCDSVITINLTITTTTFLRDTVFACDSNNFRGMNLTTAGTYYDTVFTGSCDSIYIRTLTMGYASFVTFTQFECDSFVSPTGKVWNMDGTYMDTIMNASGCDSNMTFNLTFGYISYETITWTGVICDSMVSPSGKVWTASGTYFDTIVNASGCDSAMTFNINIKYSVSRTDNITLCPGKSHRVGPYLYTTAGTYTNVFSTIPGCDSTIITNLSYYAPAVATVNYNFCTGDSVMIVGNWYYAATTFMDTIVGGSSNGCDSVTTHNLTTRTVSPALNLGADVVSCVDGGVTVFASTAYDTYNWSTGGTTNVLIVNGALSGVGTTNHILTVTQASSGCTATDDINVTFNSCVGLNEVDADLNVNLYPNPANNFVTIEIFDKYNEGNLKLEILNSIGQVISSRNISSSNEKVIMDVNNFSKGMYLVRISSDKLYMTKKLIIQK